MTETLTRSREWLLLNAVEAWLYHYKDAGTPTVAQYQELQREFHDAYMQSLSMDVVEHSETPVEPTPTRTTSTRKGKTNGSQSSAKTV
jgi:predicted component of type VI protein secretion system